MMAWIRAGLSAFGLSPAVALAYGLLGAGVIGALLWWRQDAVWDAERELELKYQIAALEATAKERERQRIAAEKALDEERARALLRDEEAKRLEEEVTAYAEQVDRGEASRCPADPAYDARMRGIPIRRDR